jgi:hypothetical protein
MSRPTLAGLAVMVALLGAAPAHAAPTWLPYTQLKSGTAESPPAASVDAGGDVTAAWADNEQNLVVSEHPAGGTWQTPVTVGSVSLPPPVPALASDAAGDTVLAYDVSGQVKAVVNPAGQPWSAPVTLSDLGAGDTNPVVAIDGRGDALVVWIVTGVANGYTKIDWSYRPAGGAWQPALTLDDDAWSNVTPSVAFTSSGRAVVVWVTADGANQALVSADLTADSAPSWQSPIQILSVHAPSFSNAQVALDSAGDATVAWDYYTGTENDVALATRPPGGTWSQADDLGASEMAPKCRSRRLGCRGSGLAAGVRRAGRGHPPERRRMERAVIRVRRDAVQPRGRRRRQRHHHRELLSVSGRREQPTGRHGADPRRILDDAGAARAGRRDLDG